MLKTNFKIENKIYSEKSIKKALKDFEGFDINYSNNELIISGENKEEVNEIFGEFMNYVLGIYNETV